MQFSVLILVGFHWKNGSIINKFHTVTPNSLRTFWKYQEHNMKWHGLGNFNLTNKKNQVTLLSGCKNEWTNGLQEITTFKIENKGFFCGLERITKVSHWFLKHFFHLI
jgi:hypothetical protein